MTGRPRKGILPAMKYDPIAIGARLKAAREAKGLTQTQIAMACRFSGTAAVHKVESGAQNISANEIMAVCEFFGISPEYLLYGADDVARKKSKAYRELIGMAQHLTDDQIETEARVIALRYGIAFPPSGKQDG